MKVVLDKSGGGSLDLSEEGLGLYNKKRMKSNLPTTNRCCRIQRHDPLLVEVIEELGDRAGGKYSRFQIDTIPVEYKDCYKIVEHYDVEYAQCRPCYLIEHQLKNLNVNELSDSDCRRFLQDMIGLLTKK
jgi:hypothetical protein